MDLSDQVLGKHTAQQLRERASAPLLRIGADVFDRGDLAGVACFNFGAAANLSRILTNELQVKNTKDVFEHVAPEALMLPRLGVISLAVLGAAFERKGLGGEHPLESWVIRHRHKDAKREFVTFGSMKEKQRAHADQEKKDTKARKATRRNKAHKIRVDRFATRTGANV